MVDEWRICTAKLVARHISVGHNVTPEDISYDTKLITFDDPRSKITNESGEVKAYTIEPDKQSSDMMQKNINDDTDSNDASLEQKSLSDIPEHRSSQLKLDTRSTQQRSDSKLTLQRPDSKSTEQILDPKPSQQSSESKATQQKQPGQKFTKKP